MALDDRPFSRYQRRPPAPLWQWPFTGQLALGEIGGVGVRVRASLLLVAVLIAVSFASTLGLLSSVLLSMSLLVMAVVHEAGHWMAARSLGLPRNDFTVSLLTDVAGGDHGVPPGAAAWVALGGPAANLVACSGLGAMLWVVAPASITLNPLALDILQKTAHLSVGQLALWWAFVISELLCVLNLLPVYPLDGGHVAYAMLRRRYGFGNAMRFTCFVGLVGSVFILIAGVSGRRPLLVGVSLGCAVVCVSRVRLLQGETDISGYLTEDELPLVPRRRKISYKAIRRARKAAIELRIEQQRLDSILAKVSKQTLASLTWKERRVLRKATERRRRLDAEP